MKRGQPTTYGPTVLASFAEHVSQGGRISTFAGRLGVTRMTVHRWRLANPEFAAAVEAASQRQEIGSAPALTPRPATGVVFSLAAWGVPLRPIPTDGIERSTITDDDVDDMLARAA